MSVSTPDRPLSDISKRKSDGSADGGSKGFFNTLKGTVLSSKKSPKIGSSPGSGGREKLRKKPPPPKAQNLRIQTDIPYGKPLPRAPVVRFDDKPTVIYHPGYNDSYDDEEEEDHHQQQYRKDRRRKQTRDNNHRPQYANGQQQQQQYDPGHRRPSYVNGHYEPKRQVLITVQPPKPIREESRLPVPVQAPMPAPVPVAGPEEGFNRVRNFSLPTSSLNPSYRTQSVSTNCSSATLDFILDTEADNFDPQSPPPKSPKRFNTNQFPVEPPQPVPQQFAFRKSFSLDAKRRNRRSSHNIAPGQFQPIPELQNESDADAASNYASDDGVPELTTESPSPVSDYNSEDTWARPNQTRGPGECGLCGSYLIMDKERRENLCLDCQREFQRQSVFLLEGFTPPEEQSAEPLGGTYNAQDSPTVEDHMESPTLPDDVKLTPTKYNFDTGGTNYYVSSMPERPERMSMSPRTPLDPRFSATFGRHVGKQIASKAKEWNRPPSIMSERSDLSNRLSSVCEIISNRGSDEIKGSMLELPESNSRFSVSDFGDFAAEEEEESREQPKRSSAISFEIDYIIGLYNTN